MLTKYTRYGVLAAMVAGPLFLAGCAQTDTTTITTTRQVADKALSTAEEALRVAQAADAKANQALAAAQSANEKVDRLFQRHLRK